MLTNIAMSNSDDERDLLQSDETESVNSLTQPLLKSSTSGTSSNASKRYLNEILFEEQNRKLAKACVMITVILERTAYYGLVGNLAYFANVFLQYTAPQSVTVTLVFSGMTWLSCFIGGVFGDAVFGRFQTILSGLVCYLMGYLSLTYLGHKSETFPTDHATDEIGKTPIYVAWFVCSLFIISFGEGCFKANMSPFGADQVDETQEHDLRTFFNYFYWSINVGSFIGFALIAWIQQAYDFCTGYIVPCCLLFLAILFFVIPRKRNYHVVSPKHNVLKIVKICCNAMRKKTTHSTFETFNPMQSRLDRAKIKYGGKFSDKEVDDVKILVSLLPTLGFLIVYCSCYSQLNGVFVIQGIHMKINIIGGGTVVPIAWFQLFNVVTVLVFVPIIDKCVYPALDRYFTQRPYLFRMSIGMLLASGSMLAAGLVEMHRIDIPASNCTNVFNKEANLIIACKDMPIWYQFPQYFCLGISEIFVLITGLEFAYCQSPKSMQSFVTSLFFVANGLGSLLATLILLAGNLAGLDLIENTDQTRAHGDPFPDLRGRLYYFFFFMGALNIVNWIGFVCYSVKRHKKMNGARKQGGPSFTAVTKDFLEDSIRKR